MIEKLAVAGVIVTGLAIGLLWPNGHAKSGGAGQSGASDVVIARNADHHYYADATVNGRSVHFMVDTGASETALTEDDAHEIGIAVDPTKYQVIGDGASGMVRGQYVQLKSIDLGGIHQKDAQAVVVQGSEVSLLGQPFLERVGEIVISQGEMRLRADASL